MADEVPTRLDVPDERISQEQAHEVLTPLTVARGYVQLARRHLLHRDGPRIDRALASLEVADSNITRLAKMVHRRAMKPLQDEGDAPE